MKLMWDLRQRETWWPQKPEARRSRVAHEDGPPCSPCKQCPTPSPPATSSCGRNWSADSSAAQQQDVDIYVWLFLTLKVVMVLLH